MPIFQSTATVKGYGNFQSGGLLQRPPEPTDGWSSTRGDRNNNRAGATDCRTDSETVVVTKADPTLSSTALGQASAAPGAAPGRLAVTARSGMRSARAPQEIYDTADLEGSISPTGTLTFNLYGPDDSTCSGAAVFLSEVPVTGNGVHNSKSFTPKAAGTYRWRVSYSR